MKTTIKFKRYIKNDPLLMKEIRFYFDGSKHWFLNGKHHREDDPAFIGSDGIKYWFLNGKYYNRKEFPEALGKYKKKNKPNK